MTRLQSELRLCQRAARHLWKRPRATLSWPEPPEFSQSVPQLGLDVKRRGEKGIKLSGDRLTFSCAWRAVGGAGALPSCLGGGGVMSALYHWAA